MTTRIRRMILTVLVLGLAATNLALLGARMTAQDSVWWKNYHWKKSNLRVVLAPSSYSRNEATKAVNIWNGRTDLTLSSGTLLSHDILVTDGLYGNMPWRGLATVIPGLNGAILTCQARLNRSYSDFPASQSRSWRWQGTYCMELGHCVGLDHDVTTGCMNGPAMSSGTTDSNVPSPQNARSINSRY